MSMDRKALSSRIRYLRKLNGMNQGELAKSSGVSERSISDMESAKGNPGIKSIEDLEGVFKAPLLNVAGSPLKLSAVPGPAELKGIVDDPSCVNPLQLANLLAAQFAEAPVEMRALALRALFDRPELLAPYERQLRDAATTHDRKKRLR